MKRIRDSHGRFVRGGGGRRGRARSSGGAEAPDSLRSNQIARYVDALCEGEILGLVNGMKSVYINGTPLENVNGSRNFGGIDLQWRNGTLTQTPMDGFSGTEIENYVGTEVKAALPITRTLNNSTCKEVRVTVAVPGLMSYDSNGNINGSFVSFDIAVQNNGGGFVTMVSDTIRGKTSSKYKRAYRLKLQGSGPWDIRVMRTTPDSTSSKVQNSLFFDAFTGIVPSVVAYINTAVVGVALNAQQFAGVPERGYEIYGRIIQVPTNYDPLTRAYSGAWDGSFKMAWSDNPAWCFYDMLTQPRFGLGDFVDATTVDKWSLYTIGKYCDQMVPNGMGGTEPRFSCNLVLQSREDAYKVIQNMASIFRAIAYWGAAGVIAVQDRPGDVAAVYTNANVIDGKFTYQGSSTNVRHTVALVAWNDPNDEYKQSVEYVQDDELVEKYGIIQMEVTAFGCTSRAQAHRYGRWALLTEKIETETVSFSCGFDGLETGTGAGLFPGAVIQTSDILRAGKRMGGRIKSGTTTVLQLDAPVTLIAGKQYRVLVAMPEGKPLERAVINVIGEVQQLTLAAALPTAPLVDAVFALVETDSVELEMWRVLGVVESDTGALECTAIKHNPSKYDSVELGFALDEIPISNISARPSAPTGLTFVVAQRSLDGSVSNLTGTLSWEGSAAKYRVAYRFEKEPWVSLETQEQSIDVPNLQIGQYEFAVTAVSALGIASMQATLTYSVTPQPIQLPDITGLSMEGTYVTDTAKFKWDAVAGATGYEVKIEAGGQVRRAVSVGNALRFDYASGDMRVDGGPWRSYTFSVRAVGKWGSASSWASLTAGNPQIAALQGIKIESGIKSGFFSAQMPAEDDIAGLLVWVGTSASVTPTADNLVYDGPPGLVTISALKNGTALAGNQTYYVRAAAYDTFGRDALNVSTAVSFVPWDVNQMVTELAESQLNQSLRTRINLIDAPGTGLVDKVGDLQVTYGNTASSAASAAAAAQSAADAANAQAAALLAKGGAETASAGASQAAADAVAAKAAAVSAQTGAVTAKDQATAAKTSAETAAGKASTSATQAASSATAAGSSASQAGTSASNAANSATSAGNSATAAGTSASNAATYASDAETSAAASETSRVAAESAKQGAASSAAAAATSASTASTKATEASQSASAANSSKTAAATSASQAGTSASQAASSATTAGTKAGEAATSATAAAGSATTASTKAGEASTSANQAASSATSAAGSATQAGTSATTAANAATTAGQKADAASTSATNAAASATAAGQSATSSASSATAASTSAGSAKTYRDEAATSATTAGTKAGEAASSANSASSSATTAANSATAAGNSASAAASSASTATTKATEAGQSAASASASANTATTKAAQASTSATSAASSATAADGSAQAAAQQVTNLVARVGDQVAWQITAAGYGKGTTALRNMAGNMLAGGGAHYRVLSISASNDPSGPIFQTHVAEHATAMANHIAGLADGTNVIVMTYDNPQSGLATIRPALISCGATGAVLDGIAWRSAYILAGVKGAGEGGGIEKYHADATELLIQVSNGKIIGLAGQPALPSISAQIQTIQTTKVDAAGAVAASETALTSKWQSYADGKADAAKNAAISSAAASLNSYKTTQAGVDAAQSSRIDSVIATANSDRVAAALAKASESGGVLRVAAPEIGAFSNGSSTVTGAIKITLPQYRTNTMLSFRVDIFDYAAGAAITYEIAGYTYESGWFNCTAVAVGSAARTKTVRFGHDGSKCCVWIGDIDSTWAYPKVRVYDFIAGHANYTAAQWETGWQVGIATGFNTIEVTIDTANAEKSAAAAMAAVQTEATARAAADNSLFAQYTIKVQSGKYFAGIGLASESPAYGPGNSKIIMLADQFGVGSPGRADQFPFVIDTVRNMVGINGNLLVNGSVTATALAADSVTADKINAGAVTANEIAANAVTADKMAVTSLSAITGNMGYLTAGEVHGGRFHSGDFVNVNWPAAGGSGFYLGPDAFRMGNRNGGKWFELYPNGNWNAPGIRNENGTLYVDQLEVIGAGNIKNNNIAVTAEVYRSGWQHFHMNREFQEYMALSFSVPKNAVLFIFIKGLVNGVVTLQDNGVELSNVWVQNGDIYYTNPMMQIFNISGGNHRIGVGMRISANFTGTISEMNMRILAVIK